MTECKSIGYSRRLAQKAVYNAYMSVAELEKASVVHYEDYGAVGDGVTDDSLAIRTAHNVANEKGIPVLGRHGARYYIGEIDEPIIIKTETNWNGAEIIFGDENIDYQSKTRSVYVFEIHSQTPPVPVEVPEGFTLKKGQKNVGMTFDSPCMLKFENSNEKIYVRYGSNANNGISKNETILVDEQGNVDPTTPVQYDYSEVTRITRMCVTDEPISVGNALATTRVYNPKAHYPDYENNYCYYGRGICVKRSNTTVYGIDHHIEGEDMTIEIDRNGDGVIDKWGADKSYGVPYIGFFYFNGCNNALMTDCFVQGHQAYSFYQGANRDLKNISRNEMGSYDINAQDCINLKLNNVIQHENEETGEVITNRFMYHGVMGSNFCRNVVMENSYVDRFDSHQGVHNVIIRNCTLGFGILVIGGGDLIIENVYRVSGNAFIHLRMDYNSVFDGDVIMKKCRLGKGMANVVEGMWVSFYNGLDHRITNSLSIDGLISEGDNVTLYNIRNATADSLTDATNRLIVPEFATVKNVTAPDGAGIEVKLAVQSDAFSGTKFTV